MTTVVCGKTTPDADYGIRADSRIAIVGTSGSGKSVLAGRIARALGLKDIELDALFWKPGWEQSSEAEFRARIREAIPRDRGYVIHGNYGKVRDLTWAGCDLLVWLDYSKPVVMYRVVTRTLRRIIARERLWGGNVETWRSGFLAGDSIIAWAWKTHGTRRRQYASLGDATAFGIPRMVVVGKPRDLRYLMGAVERAARTRPALSP